MEVTSLAGIVNQEGRLIVKEEKNIELTHIDKIKAKEQIYDTMLLLTNMILKEAEIPNFLVKKLEWECQVL